MPDECPFCGIVDGDIPSHGVYETDEVYAFLDVNPLAEGHTLVIPKSHHRRLNDLPAELSGAIGTAVAEVADAVETAVDTPATTVAYNNGEAAGQEVPHVHAHVIPRSPEDGSAPIHSLFDAPTRADDDELAAVAEDIGAEV